MKRLINWVIYHKIKFIIFGALILLGNIFPKFGKLIGHIVVYGILIGAFILIWLLKDNNVSSFNTPIEYDEEIIIPEKSEFEKQQEEFINYHYYYKKDMGPLAEDQD